MRRGQRNDDPGIERASTGVDGIDALLDGGLPRGRLYLVSGPPGSGKTTFSAQFVTEGVIQGERGLYVSMHETLDDLRADLGSFEFGFDRALDTDELMFVDALSSEGRRFLGRPGENRDQSSLLNRIVGFINSQSIERVAIDSTMLLRHLLSDDENSLIGALTSLKRADATVILISEMTDPTAYSNEHYLAHGVVFFHNYLDAEGMTRGVQVVKMRGTDIDTDIHTLGFTDAGLGVDPDATETR
jgi:KaiC/GvpD/RAD55 family RecA-like ATPase